MERIIKVVVYLSSFGIVLYAMSCLNYEKFLKGNKIVQAQILYVLIACAIGFLVAEFFLNLAY